MSEVLRFEFGLALAGASGALAVVLGGGMGEPVAILWGAGCGALWGGTSTLVSRAEQEGRRLMALLIVLGAGGWLGLALAGWPGFLPGALMLQQAAVLSGDIEEFGRAVLFWGVPLAALWLASTLEPPYCSCSGLSIQQLWLLLGGSHWVVARGLSLSAILIYLALFLNLGPLAFGLVVFKILRALWT